MDTKVVSTVVCWDQASAHIQVLTHFSAYFIQPHSAYFIQPHSCVRSRLDVLKGRCWSDSRKALRCILWTGQSHELDEEYYFQLGSTTFIFANLADPQCGPPSELFGF